MSGPKIDNVEIERQKKAELERARLEHLNKVMQATGKLNETQDNIRNERAAFRRELDLLTKLDFPEMEQTIGELNTIFYKYSQEVDQLLIQNVPSEPEDIISFNNAISSRAKQLVKEAQASTKEGEHRIQEFLADKAKSKEFKSITIEKKSEGMSVGSFNFALAKEEIQEQLKQDASMKVSDKKLVEQMLKKLESMFNDVNIPKIYMNKLSKVIDNLYHAVNEQTKYTKIRISECSSLTTEIEYKTKGFVRAYREYYALYIEYLKVKNSSQTNPLIVIPKSPEVFESPEKLFQELGALKIAYKRESEQRYIRDQLNEVMCECGYELTKELVFDEKKSGINYVCQKSKDNTTGVHIFVSETNELMMAVTGISTGQMDETTGKNAKRIGVDALSDAEKKKLMNEQSSFCSKHPKIIEKLKEKGVVLSEKKYREPNIDYCRWFEISDNVINSVQNDTLINLQGQNIRKKDREKEMVRRA